MQKRLFILIMLFVVFTLSSCNFPVQPNYVPAQAIYTPTVVQAQETPEPTSAPIIYPPTPTPFLPLDPTAVNVPDEPTKTPSWGKYPGPVIPPAVPVPPPAPIFQVPSGQINVLLMGSDQRIGQGGYRTDTILLVTLHPNQGTVNITSFPRDLYVYVPGWTMQRINTAHPHGGFELTEATFEYNFGVELDYYVVTNFWGFVDVVDNLGGIYVDVGKSLTDHRDGYGNYTVPAGHFYMDGETALWYVRSRYSTSDFERTIRQQEVLIALFQRLMSLDALLRMPELFSLYTQHVETNIDLETVMPLLGLASKIAAEPSAITRYAVGRDQVTSYTVPGSGAQVLLPNQEEVLKVMRRAVNAP